MNQKITDDSKATKEWLDSTRSKSTRDVYLSNWNIWIDYCTRKGLLTNGSEQLEDMKARRLSTDQTEKFFYDNEMLKFFKWLQTEYVSARTKKPLSEGSAFHSVNTIRSFFAFHRYTLEIQKDKLPSSEKLGSVYTDHAFDIYQLRSMFQCGDLRERTVLSCAKDLWFRVGDFSKINRELIELAIKREKEQAENEKRDLDVVEFEITTEKEKEPASCHLSHETLELLEQYLKTYPKTEFLFDLSEKALNDIIVRLAKESKITLDGRVRFHCLRKFGITTMHGKVTEPVMKYMCGKHISKDLRTYIQRNRETYKAFKMLEPLISLTKSNGQSSNLSKQLDELKKEAFKRVAFQKLLEKIIPKEDMQKAIEELAKEFGLEKPKHIKTLEEPLDLDFFITTLAKKIEDRELKRILEENGNHNSDNSTTDSTEA